MKNKVSPTKGEEEMRKIIGDFNTVLILEKDEPKMICRLGQGEKCCPWLVGGANGFECWRMNYPSNSSISHRIDEGTMNAKGKECDWDKVAKKSKEVSK